MQSKIEELIAENAKLKEQLKNEQSKVVDMKSYHEMEINSLAGKIRQNRIDYKELCKELDQQKKDNEISLKKKREQVEILSAQVEDLHKYKLFAGLIRQIKSMGII